MSANPSPVPKPSQPGAAQSALARTKASFANIRNGPSTSHAVAGQLRNLTLVQYFPGTRTGDGWVWIEQGSVGGWVSTSVVTFDNTPRPPINNGPTPYSGAVALWHWRGDSVGENTIEELARNIRTYAPYVTQVWVKTSDSSERLGAQWMGAWDKAKPSLAINGPADIARWVQTLNRYNLEFHAWCVPVGRDPNAEADLIIQACKVAGVRSMILDVEPYDGFWEGGAEGIRPFMTRIRRELPGSFHIGMSVDPRSHHYDSIFPDEWKPFVNSIHPQAYSAAMQRDPDDILNETYAVWGPFGKPIIPALQGNAPESEISGARTIAINQYQAQGLSWFRVGVMGPVEFNLINRPMTDGTQPKPQPPEIMYGPEQIVRPGEAGYNDFSYTGTRELQEFTNLWGWKAFYTTTQSRTSRTAARWTPRITKSAKFEVSVFVPGRHSTTGNARFKVYGVTGSSAEVVIPVSQKSFSNQWVPLGIYDFDPRTINAGTVFLNDLTGEDGLVIAFDAVKWQEVIYVEPKPPGSGTPTPAGYADGYDQPVGTETERRGSQVWAGKWYNASPYAKLYFAGTPSQAYHTGADLNLPGDSDARSGVFAASSGSVTFAGPLSIWGNVIIIRHDPLVTNGQVMYGRYGHVERMIVKVGDRVARGQQIASVGNGMGRFAYHLHFDLSPTTVLAQKPQDWPGMNLERLKKDYVDPEIFIRANRPR
jgi:murein DD-endopeptidase MepM/ murein hydrolase activator NlpD